MKLITTLRTAAFATLIIGCATAGTKPHDMSVEEHERAGQGAQTASEEHADKFDPMQETSTDDCGAGFVCWSTWTNPTAEHKREAERYRALAKKHRAAAQALRAAEQEACSEIDERDRDVSPFFHTEDIVRVSIPATESKDPVEVEFRKVPGLTSTRLQQELDCHIARSASMGHEMPDMDYCPLVPRGVRAVVSEREEVLVVSVNAESDPQSRSVVLERARVLESTIKKQ